MVISMDRWKGKVAVVTGASAGIGAAIVEQLVEAGLDVIGIARRKNKMDLLQKTLQGKSGKFYTISADVTKEDDILRAFKWAKDNVGPIHILINNAGISRTTTLVDGSTSMWKDILNTNVMGLCVATREAIKSMHSNNVDGHIVHINSILGHKVANVPNLNVYPGAKFAVTALTETLRQELVSMGSKIKVTSISPGLVATEIFEASAIGSGEKGVPQHMEDFLKVAPILQPSDVADAVIYALATPPHVQIHELTIKPVGETF